MSELWIKFIFIFLLVLFVLASFIRKYKKLDKDEREEAKNEIKFSTFFFECLQVIGLLLLLIAIIFSSKLYIYIAIGAISISLLVKAIKNWNVNKKERNSLLFRVLIAWLGTILFIQLL
jgi:Ca2+/Na+ antiporter